MLVSSLARRGWQIRNLSRYDNYKISLFFVSARAVRARLVTHAFVRPGRSRDFVRHVGCVSPELMRAVIAAHGSVERVPAEKGMDGDALSGTCAQLCRVAVLDAD